MRTNDLIAALAADTTPAPRPGPRLAAALAGGLVVSVLAFALGWGPREGLGGVLSSPLVAKTLIPALLATLALALAVRLIRPGAPTAGRDLALGTTLAALGLWLGAALLVGGPGDLAMALDKPDLWVCLVSVPILSAAPLAGVLWALRSGASTRPALTGAVAGLAAGGLGAALYSLFCVVDMALFVLPASGTAILGVVGLGALAGARWLRW
jgi:hypothetical protein